MPLRRTVPFFGILLSAEQVLDRRSAVKHYRTFAAHDGSTTADGSCSLRCYAKSATEFPSDAALESIIGRGLTLAKRKRHNQSLDGESAGSQVPRSSGECLSVNTLFVSDRWQAPTLWDGRGIWATFPAPTTPFAEPHGVPNAWPPQGDEHANTTKGGRGSCRAARVDGRTITCAARVEPRPPKFALPIRQFALPKTDFARSSAMPVWHAQDALGMGVGLGLRSQPRPRPSRSFMARHTLEWMCH